MPDYAIPFLFYYQPKDIGLKSYLIKILNNFV